MPLLACGSGLEGRGGWVHRVLLDFGPGLGGDWVVQLPLTGLGLWSSWGWLTYPTVLDWAGVLVYQGVAGSTALCWTGALVWEEGVAGLFSCLWLSWSSCLGGGGGWFRYLLLDLGFISARGGWFALLLLTGLGLWFSRGWLGLLCCA